MVDVYRSTVVDAPLDSIWPLLRDFNSHHQWHPAIADSVIEQNKLPDQVGCIRRFTLQDGSVLREQLLSLSDFHRSLSYCVLDAPIPLQGYVATLRLRSVSDGATADFSGAGKTFVEWFSNFRTPDGRENELAELVGRDIYEAGFKAIKKWFSRRRQSGSGTGLPEPDEPAERQRPPAANETVALTAGAANIADVIEGHAIIVRRYGGPEQLVWESVSFTGPSPRQVRVRHSAIGVNYIDIYCRSGQFSLLQTPGTPGMEAAGVIVDVGSDVTGLQPGTRVAYACEPVGAYAEYRNVDGASVVPLPDSIAEETAAAIMLKGITAEFLLHRVYPVQPGDTVLVHAAAGGVGLLLCQWASHLGATVIGTVGGREKAALAQQSGCAYAIDYTREDFAARVMEITDGRGVQVVYDAVGRDTLLRSYEALAVRGHLVSYGQASGAMDPVDIGAFAAKSVTLSRPNFSHFTQDAASLKSASSRLFNAVMSGALRVRVNHRYPLSAAADAHTELEARRTTGSILLLP